VHLTSPISISLLPHFAPSTTTFAPPAFVPIRAQKPQLPPFTFLPWRLYTTAKTMASPTLKLNSGHQMPQVGFGLWKVDNATCADTVYNAIKVGYRLFDGACGKLPAPQAPRFSSLKLNPLLPSFPSIQ
jgi:hypothetical protein